MQFTSGNNLPVQKLLNLNNVCEGNKKFCVRLLLSLDIEYASSIDSMGYVSYGQQTGARSMKFSAQIVFRGCY